MSTLIRQTEDLSSLHKSYYYPLDPISQTEEISSLQDSEGRFVTVIPRDPTPTPHYQYPRNLQTHEYLPPKIENKNASWWSSATEQYFPWLDNAQQQLKEIRQEAMEASALDSEIDPVPESAYDDAHSLLKMLSHYNVPMPDISWAEDGSLGFEWRPENGIATMGVYGDNHVIYGAFFDDKRQVEGICSLSDTALLQGFLMTLLNLPF